MEERGLVAHQMELMNEVYLVVDLKFRVPH